MLGNGKREKERWNGGASRQHMAAGAAWAEARRRGRHQGAWDHSDRAMHQPYLCKQHFQQQPSARRTAKSSERDLLTLAASASAQLAAKLTAHSLLAVKYVGEETSNLPHLGCQCQRNVLDDLAPGSPGELYQCGQQAEVVGEESHLQREHSLSKWFTWHYSYGRGGQHCPSAGH